MLLPYLIGLRFERGRYNSLGLSLVGLEATVVGCTLAAWRITARARAAEVEPPAEEEDVLLEQQEGGTTSGGGR